MLQESTKVENVVTIGATLLSNTTDAYASFAVLIYQAFGRKVCAGSPGLLCSSMLAWAWQPAQQPASLLITWGAVDPQLLRLQVLCMIREFLLLAPAAQVSHAAAVQALNASSIIWNAHLLNGSEPALDLNDATVVEGIFTDAAAHVDNTKDYLLPSQMNQLSSDQYMAAATSAANLNQLVDSASNQTSFAKTAYYTQDSVRTLLWAGAVHHVCCNLCSSNPCSLLPSSAPLAGPCEPAVHCPVLAQVAPMVTELTENTITPQEYMDSTSAGQLSSGVASTQLPTSSSSSSTTGSQYGSSATQSASTSSSSGSGMSGGAIAGTVVGVVVGVALIALVAALLIRRSSRSSGTQSV